MWGFLSKDRKRIDDEVDQMLEENRKLREMVQDQTETIIAEAIKLGAIVDMHVSEMEKARVLREEIDRKR